MGGWFRREIKGLSDMQFENPLSDWAEKRSAALVTPQTTPPRNFTSLQSGGRFSVEFVGPARTSRLVSIVLRHIITVPVSTSRTALASASSRSKRGSRSTRSSKRSSRMLRGGSILALAEMERLNVRRRWPPHDAHGCSCARFRRTHRRRAQAGGRRAGWSRARSVGARKVHDSYVAFRERRGVVAHFAQGGAGGADG
jgi:hypothetical protein